MRECKQCGKGIESTGNRPKVFCSDRCRVAFNRTSQSEQSKANIQSEQGGTIGPVEERSSSTGDPRDTESGEMSAKAMTAEIIEIEKDLRQPSPLEDVETTTSGNTESGMERAIAASAKLVADEQVTVEHTPQEIIEIDEHGVVTSSADHSTSQCYRDSGIPLPGDQGYKGRENMTYPAMLKRYALGTTTYE